MSMLFHEDRPVSTRRAVDDVIPLIKGLFFLDEHHKVLPDVDISRLPDGGAVVSIRLSDIISPAAMEELDHVINKREDKS